MAEEAISQLERFEIFILGRGRQAAGLAYRGTGSEVVEREEVALLARTTPSTSC
jgi:hypothetical protein